MKNTALHDQWRAVPSEGDAAVGARIWKRIDRALGRRNFFRRLGYVSLSSIALAACLVIGWFLGVRSVPEPAKPVRTWVAADGTGQKLPDGSIVYLEKGGVLQFSDDFPAQRRVSLRGAASFDVTKSPEGKEFIIELEGSSIKVLGTSFSVRQSVDETSVTLYDGVVEFQATGRTVRLEPAQSLVYNRVSGQIDTRPFFSEIHWQSGRYSLSDLSLKQIMDFISWRYGVEVLMTGIPEANRRLTGSIGVQEPLESVLDKVCYVLHLRYRLENDQVSITKG